LFAGTLDWQVDVCTADVLQLQRANRDRIRLYVREDGEWTKLDGKAATERGERCGPDRVHISVPATEPTPAASATGQGWSECRDHRLVLPETKRYARTTIDMCVRTRADEPQ
jgi:hypothetical protein